MATEKKDEQKDLRTMRVIVDIDLRIGDGGSWTDLSDAMNSISELGIVREIALLNTDQIDP